MRAASMGAGGSGDTALVRGDIGRVVGLSQARGGRSRKMSEAGAESGLVEGEGIGCCLVCGKRVERG
jgi:hypothetical protein